MVFSLHRQGSSSKCLSLHQRSCRRKITDEWAASVFTLPPEIQRGALPGIEIVYLVQVEYRLFRVATPPAKTRARARDKKSSRRGRAQREDRALEQDNRGNSDHFQCKCSTLKRENNDHWQCKYSTVVYRTLLCFTRISAYGHRMDPHRVYSLRPRLPLRHRTTRVSVRLPSTRLLLYDCCAVSAPHR